MTFRFKEIEVVSRLDGSREKAELATCECGSEGWIVYKVKEHIHLQCQVCGETYCQNEGHCSAANLL